MKYNAIPKTAIDFLRSVSKNNNREWFNAHKEHYLEAYEQIIGFADALLEKMNVHDHLETESGKKSIYRIYADTRFSKDKNPYKTHWGIRFKRATQKLRGGYYLHLEPGNSFIAGGFFAPNPEDLKRIRQDIDFNYDDWNKMLSGKQLVKTFGTLRGEQVSIAPKGYAKDHPAIELLRYKQFLLRHSFTDEEVLAKDFTGKASDIFKSMRPFLDHMSEVLTTDLNGVSII
ncbi:MAG: DUF2461 domain-containing protein [Bacteroidota bacterium]